MQHSHILRNLTGSGALAAMLVCSALPAIAHPHADGSHERASATPRAQARAYASPRNVNRIYAAPRAMERTYTQPRDQMYREPRRVTTYAAPRRVATYAAPPREVRMYREPRRVTTYAAPRREVRMYRAPRRVTTYAAPRREVRMYRAPRRVTTYAAPRTSTAVVRHYVRSIAPRRTVLYRSRAPFVQYVRVARRSPARWTRVRQVIASPLMRAMYTRPRRTVVEAYHPAYLTGRIVAIRRNELVIAPPTGREIIINRYVPTYTRYRVNQYATIPAVYSSGNYAYACSPQYYPQVAQYYANYYGTQVSYVNGCYVPQNAAAAYYYDPYAQYGTGYGSPGYGTPYDNCMWAQSDNDGDEYCAATQGTVDAYGNYPYGNAPYGNDPYGGYPYGNDSYGNAPYSGYPYGGYPYGNDPYGNDPYGNVPYGNVPYGDYPYGNDPYAGYPYGAGGQYGAYAMQQVQGLVVAKTGTTLMVLGGNGLKPIFVNAAPALQNGYAVNGPVAVGQVVDAFGFYNGDMFVATALM